MFLRARIRPAEGGMMVVVQVHRDKIGWVDVDALPQQMRLAIAVVIEAWARAQM